MLPVPAVLSSVCLKLCSGSQMGSPSSRVLSVSSIKLQPTSATGSFQVPVPKDQQARKRATRLAAVTDPDQLAREGRTAVMQGGQGQGQLW